VENCLNYQELPRIPSIINYCLNQHQDLFQLSRPVSTIKTCLNYQERSYSSRPASIIKNGLNHQGLLQLSRIVLIIKNGIDYQELLQLFQDDLSKDMRSQS